MAVSWPHRSLGDPQAPTLIFLHGFLGSGRDWLPVAEAFSSTHHILLPDLPGHGAHTRRDPGALDFESLSAELAGFVQSFSGVRPVLIGYSLGGRLALHFACSHPAQAGALILESASPGLTDPTERAARAAQDDALAGRLRSGGLAAFVESWYRADLWRSLRSRPDLLAQISGDRLGGDAVWLARVLSELSPGRMPPLWDCLPGLRLPVLLLAGDLDPKYPAVLRRAGALIPNAVHTLIPGAGHNIHLEQPEAFIQALRPFLEASLHR